MACITKQIAVHEHQGHPASDSWYSVQLLLLYSGKVKVISPLGRLGREMMEERHLGEQVLGWND